jgi:ATP-dependent protease ClpP protease subunit
MTRLWTPSQVQNLRQTGRASWYRIDNTAGGVTEVAIYDSIGEFGVSARDFQNDLAQVRGAVELHLNTEGGEVFDGLAIYDALKRRGGVTVVVDSLAASIGSVIAQAGERRVMARNATMMIHDASSGVMGNAADMTSMAELLDKTSDNIASVYAERAGGTTEDWRGAMRATTWYSAEEAVSAGLADEVRGAAPVTNRLSDADTPDHGNITVPDAADLNAAARRYAASQGWAMPDGSYPIRQADNHGASDLSSAIRAVGRGSGSHDTIRAHIVKRAKAIGMADRIPDNWPGAPARSSDALDMSAIQAALRSLKETE